MSDTEPQSSAWPRLALAALVVVLVGVVAYIIHLQGPAAGPGARAAASPARPPAAAAERATFAPVASEPGVITEAAIAAVLTPSQQQAMEDVLKPDAAPDRTAWFHIQQNNAETGAVQAALARVFEQSGWKTGITRTPYPLKSGIFLLAADEHPPQFVEAVNDAFGAAGIDVQYLTDYRAFFTDRKKQNPNWRGPELDANQAFTIIIGSKPTPKPGGGESESSSGG